MSDQRARILRELAARFGVRGTSTSDDEVALEVAPEVAGAVLDMLSESGATPLGAWGDDGPVANYLVGLASESLRFVVTQRLPKAARGEFASLAASHPTLAAGEREIAETLGVGFSGHPDPRPLLRRRGGNTAPQTTVHGAGVSSLRIGPVAPGAGIEESSRLELEVIGDRIVHAESFPFVKHRGVEPRLTGLTPLAAAAVVERICGRCALANVVAFAIAIERMAAVDLPLRASWIRVCLLEIERIAAHAEAIAEIARSCDHTSGWRRALVARESLLGAVEAAFGSRLVRGVIVPGGLSRDLPADNTLRSTTAVAAVELRGLVHDLLDLPQVRVQLKDVGTITPQVARELSLTGPVARAAGSRRDVRLSHPYLAYAELKPWAPVHVGGDALARLRVMHEEIEQSATLTEEVLRHLPPGKIREPISHLPAGKRGIGMVESPRGGTLHVVYSDEDGRIRRYWMRGASDVNAVAVPIAMLDHDVADYPRVAKSFALCAACIER